MSDENSKPPEALPLPPKNDSNTESIIRSANADITKVR
jgi:hypothetical protein